MECVILNNLIEGLVICPDFVIKTYTFKIRHAGTANTETDVYNEDNFEYGILWTRKELKNIGKLQIIDHTPHELQDL